MPKSSAVFLNDCLISSGLHSGCACFNKAEAPATIGVAIEVPDSAICLLSMHLWISGLYGLLYLSSMPKAVSHCAAQISTPGATTSGLINVPPFHATGPLELKKATLFSVGFLG